MFVEIAAILGGDRRWRALWGGNLLACVRGQVSQRCGGNRVN